MPYGSKAHQQNIQSSYYFFNTPTILCNSSSEIFTEDGDTHYFQVIELNYLYRKIENFYKDLENG